MSEFSELVIERLGVKEHEHLQLAQGSAKGDNWVVQRGKRDRMIALADRIVAEERPLNVFFGPNPVEESKNGKQRASNSEVTRFTSFFMDLDFQPNKLGSLENAIRAIEFFTIIAEWMPAAVVNTGGGLHAYWTMEYELGVVHEQKYNCKRALVAVQNWAQDYGLGSIDTVVDPTRLLRVPGSRNYKYDPAPLAYLVGAFTQDKEGSVSCLTLSQSADLLAGLSVQEGRD